MTTITQQLTVILEKIENMERENKRQKTVNDHIHDKLQNIEHLLEKIKIDENEEIQRVEVIRLEKKQLSEEIQQLKDSMKEIKGNSLQYNPPFYG